MLNNVIHSLGSPLLGVNKAPLYLLVANLRVSIIILLQYVDHMVTIGFDYASVQQLHYFLALHSRACSSFMPYILLL